MIWTKRGIYHQIGESFSSSLHPPELIPLDQINLILTKWH